METINGLTNWKLTVRREKDCVRILRALTCDRKAILPDALFGLPVMALGDQALAEGAQPVEGETLCILGGAESGDWDNRNITELTLPCSLQSIGDYAFMNLRSLEKLRFYDDLLSTGRAGFINCRCFSRLELIRTSQRQGPALASFVQNLRQELEVTVLNVDGSMMRLIFPEYIEDYTENSPGRYFQLRISGGGYAYHSVFRDRTLSAADYDALWPAFIARAHDEESALRLAYCRLCWPARLSEQAGGQYASFLRANIERAISHALREKDMHGLRVLLDLGELEDGALDEALSEARDLHLTEATAVLLEKRRMRPAAGRRRSFAL